jgi:hypothetical protein
MQRLILGTAVVVGVLLSGAAVRADGEAAAIVDKAIKATGGADVIKKFAALKVQTKGKFYGMGDGIDYKAEESFQAPDRFFLKIDATGFSFSSTVNGDKGWIKFGDNVMEMTKEQMEKAKEDLYAGGLARLLPLKHKGVTLSQLGEVKVDGKPAVGVRAESKGHADVSLYFDKESGLLVKTERRTKDDSGAEVTQETLYSDYKKVEGMQVPMKAVINHDGKKFIESENTDVKLSEKLPDSTFDKP